MPSVSSATPPSWWRRRPLAAGMVLVVAFAGGVVGVYRTVRDAAGTAGNTTGVPSDATAAARAAARGGESTASSGAAGTSRDTTLTESRIAELVRTPPAAHLADAPRPYDLYLKGRNAWHRRTEEGLLQAVELFNAAIQLAPTYALAHAGLADALAVLGFYGFLPADDAFPAARVAARRAVEIDPALGEAYATLGYVALYHDWTFPAAEEAFRRAISLQPGYSTAHQWYSNFLTSRGRFDEAVREMRRAQELDPLSLIANAALGWVHLHAGRFDDAVLQLRRMLEINAEFELAWLWLGQSEGERGRMTEAFDALRTAERLSHGAAAPRAALARVFALAGRADSARRIVAALERTSGPRHASPYDIALVHAALGNHPAALSWLERAIRERVHAVVFMRVDPRFAVLRTEAHFAELIARVEGDPARSTPSRSSR